MGFLLHADFKLWGLWWEIWRFYFYTYQQTTITGVLLKEDIHALSTDLLFIPLNSQTNPGLFASSACLAVWLLPYLLQTSTANNFKLNTFLFVIVLRAQHSIGII
jgi:hypothetical protein